MDNKKITKKSDVIINMKPIFLLENENILLELNRKNDTLILTNECISHSKKGWYFNNIKSLLLKEISSVSVQYRSYFRFAILGLLSGLITFIMIISDCKSIVILFGILFTGLMIVLFFLTRRQSINIVAANDKIYYDISGYSVESQYELIDTIKMAVNRMRKG